MWRQSDVESLGGVSVSSSIERQAMREQLDTVRGTLNALAGTGSAPPVSVSSGPNLEAVLSEIASKLGNIEGLYGSLTELADRLQNSEKNIREIQHIQHSAIHETARLVDYVGTHATPNPRAASLAGGGPAAGASAGGAAMRARHMAAAAGGVPSTPPPGTASASAPRSALAGLDYAGHVGATLHQHASQIHKLIAGLDFLEAHIIRQDQAVEGLQKQAPGAVALPVGDGRLPSELSLRVHDMGEMINKLRSHMYKVEKKSSGGEQALVALTARLETLADRLRTVEASSATAAGSSGGSAQQRHDREDDGQAAATSQLLRQLAAAQEEVRGMVLDLGRDVSHLRDQVAEQEQARQEEQSAAAAAARISAEEGADMRRQLAYLMSHVPALVEENSALKAFAASANQKIADLASARDQQEQELAALHSVASSTSRTGPDASIVADAAEEGLRRVSAVEEAVADVCERLEGVATREEVDGLSAAVRALAEQQQQRPSPSPQPAERRSSMAGAEAAALSAEVAAAAKADLGEHVGRMRERLEVAAAAAEAAAARSTEVAEAASARFNEESEAMAVRIAEALEMAANTATSANEAVQRAGAAAATGAASALQESVLAMVAGMEQEQAALRQQLASLAAQMSEEQAAISSGLTQVQEQVEAATAAALDAAACAQLVQQQHEQQGDPSEALQQVQGQLHEQVASVMEGLKERVEQAMQQVDEQVSAVHAQTEASLQELRTAASDAAERGELALASVEGLRSELILLTGATDVTQSRLEALEAAVGVDPRSAMASPLGDPGVGSGFDNVGRVEASAAAGLDEEQAAEGADAEGDGEEDGSGGGGVEAARAARAVRVAAGGGGLLDLMAELRARVCGLEGAVEAAAVDMEQVRDQLQGSAQEAHDSIQMISARLVEDLQGLSAAVGGMDERVASAAGGYEAIAAASIALQRQTADQADATSGLAAQLQELKARLEDEVVARVHETSEALSSLTTRIARDYVNREQLGAIFQARADMKRAVDELASVFDTGRLMREASSDDAAVQAPSRSASVSMRDEGAGSGSAALSPRLVAALEDLAGKQAELEQQVRLALYRTESAVRHEQLSGIQQAMVTLEMQFKRLGAAPSQQHPAMGAAAAGGAVAVAAAVAVAEATSQEAAELRARIEALEAALATGGAAKAPSTGGGATSATRRRTVSRDGGAVHLCLSSAGPGSDDSPVRVRLVVDGPDGCGNDSSAEDGAEPSLSQLLMAEEAANEAGVEDVAGAGLQAALAAAAEVRELRGVLGDLTELCSGLQDQVTHGSTERQRLEESLSELQERLDSQVNASASTMALMATMATDQHEQRHVSRESAAAREGAAPGSQQELSALASTVAMLAQRLQAAEDSLEAAFVVRTPRSPTSRGAVAAAAAAAVAAADAAEASAAAAEGSGEDLPSGDVAEARRAASTRTRAAPTVVTQEADGGDAGGEEEEEDSDDDGGPTLGLMVPVVPREMEQQLVALAAGIKELTAALGALGGRVEGLEEAGALEDVRAAASEVVLEAIPGAIAQQLEVVRGEVEAVVGRQGEQLAELVRRAEAAAAESKVAVAEVAASREQVEEVAIVVRGAVAVAEAAREAAAAREEAATAALDAVESAVREAAVEAEAARNAVVDAEAARQAAQEAQVAAEAAAAAAVAAVQQAAACAAPGGMSEAAQEAVVAAAVSAARAAAAEAAGQVSAAAREAAVEAAVMVARDAAAVATQRAVGAAQEAAAEAVMAAAARVASPRRDEHLVASVASLAAEVKDVRLTVEALTERLNDVDSLRDQLEALAEQVRYAAAVASATEVAAAAGIASQAPDTPPFGGSDNGSTAAAVASIFTPAASAVNLPPARTPRISNTSGTSPVGGRPSGLLGAAGGGGASTASQQAAFLARLVEVVKRQSSRLHSQYSDAEETGVALNQVDQTLEEAQARLADVRDMNSAAFAETMVTVLEQVAALRYIGSQTHPAIQQMVLQHENRLEEMTEQLKSLPSGSSGSPPGADSACASGPSAAGATAALAEEVVSVVRRVGRLEAELGAVGGQAAALDAAVGTILAAVEGLRRQPAADGGRTADAAEFVSGSDGPASASSLEVVALGAKVRLLEESLSAKLGGVTQEVRSALEAHAVGGFAFASASDLSAVDGRVATLHAAAAAMRNKLLAVQEYVDSTQGMLKDMHVAMGGLHRKVDVLEADGGGSGAPSGRASVSGEPASLREIQADVVRMENRLLAVEGSALEAAHGLAGLKGLGPRLTEAEARLADAGAKLAAALGGSSGGGGGGAPVIPAPGAGVTLPAVAGGLRALERRVATRLEGAVGALEALSGSLNAAGRIERESTANPFKAISAAVNNPVVVALEKKVETVRAELLTAASTLLEDLRRDARESLDLSGGGGGAYYGGGGLTFRP